MKFDNAILVALITSVTAIVTAAIAYTSAKKRETEADWRKLKLQMYQEFTNALAGMAEGDATYDIKVRFNIASNSLNLIASKEVVNALEEFRKEISLSNKQNFSVERHDRMLSNLFWYIRKDLGDSPTGSAEDFHMKLWTSGAKRP